MGILSLNAGINLEKLIQQTGCRNWVADGTNSVWKIQEWKKQAEQLHLRFAFCKPVWAFTADFDRMALPYSQLTQSLRQRTTLDFYAKKNSVCAEFPFL